MSFFKVFFASLLGHLVGGIIFAVLLIWIVSGVISSAEEESVTAVKDHSLLHLTFSSAISDRSPNEQPFQKIVNGGGAIEGMNTYLEAIERASEDPRIDGIFLDFNGISAGMATTEEIRNALIDFKASGKFIVAYSEGYSQKGYYLASVADEVYLYPEGGLDWRGLGGSSVFLKGFFEKTGIEMQVIRGKNNRFKSAVEPFMYEKMSDANREQTMTYLGSMWTHMLEGIGSQRGLNPDDLNTIADTLGIRTGQDVVDKGFIDALKYRDEIIALLQDKTSKETTEELNTIKIGKYANAGDWPGRNEGKKRITIFDAEKIAVVYAVGEIQSGEGDDQTIGSDRIARAIKEAREDTMVKAIVFRVNSPGGSALASDVIWREVMLAREAKPFVVSMGDVAASGGYYISCAAHKIYADPNTITGSIGVFGTLPFLGDAMEQNLGVTVDSVKTNKFATLGDPFFRLSQEEYDIIQGSVEEVYSTFINRVADGRGMTPDDVDSIGQGRVWSGIDAKRIGLIDDFGGMLDAIDEAVALSGVDSVNYRLVEYPKQKDPLEELLKQLGGDAEMRMAKEIVGDNPEMIEQLRSIRAMMQRQGVQARMPVDIIIR